MPAPKTFKNRFFDTLLSFKQYLRFLAGQGVTLPSYGTLLQWSNFISYTQGLIPRNLAAYYANDPSSIMLDSSGNVILWADSSGNSATNCLCLNGVTANNASAIDSTALSVTGDIDIQVKLSLASWTPAAVNGVVSKYVSAGNQRSYYFAVLASGSLAFTVSADGITGGASGVSTVGTGFAALSTNWIRCTRSAATGDIVFYTSNDGVSWTQLGSTRPTTPSGIFDSSAIFLLGSSQSGASETMTGNIYRAQVYNGIQGQGGVLAFDADFSKVPKLSSVFTEQSVNAAAVTVNTTGATGARIAGERDLYQGTAAARPAYTAAVNGNRLFLTFDGSDDYLKSPSFALSQPESVYIVGSKPTWVSLASVFDGNVADSMTLQQAGLTPQIRLFAGSVTTVNPDWTLGTRAILTSIFNGAVSYVQVNRGSIPVPASAGASNGSGFTLGARPTPDRFANIVAQEIAIYSEAHNPQTASTVQGYFASKFGISL